MYKEVALKTFFYAKFGLSYGYKFSNWLKVSPCVSPVLYYFFLVKKIFLKVPPP